MMQPLAICLLPKCFFSVRTSRTRPALMAVRDADLESSDDGALQCRELDASTAWPRVTMALIEFRTRRRSRAQNDLIEPASISPVAGRWRYRGWRRPPAQPYLWRALRGACIPWVRPVPLHTTRDGRGCGTPQWWRPALPSDIRVEPKSNRTLPPPFRHHRLARDSDGLSSQQQSLQTLNAVTSHSSG
jgi:hypothetical protein